MKELPGGRWNQLLSVSSIKDLSHFPTSTSFLSLHLVFRQPSPPGTNVCVFLSPPPPLQPYRTSRNLGGGIRRGISSRYDLFGLRRRADSGAGAGGRQGLWISFGSRLNEPVAGLQLQQLLVKSQLGAALKTSNQLEKSFKKNLGLFEQ